MGAKTWMLVYANSDIGDTLKNQPELDREATAGLATALFPKEKLVPAQDGELSFTDPPDNELYIGCFSGVSVVAAKEFGIDHPSKIPERFIAAGKDGTIVLHAMHSVVDWFAYAKWVDGRLVRSLSISPDTGIIEDIGQQLPFEQPFWSGHHPATDDDADDDYPLPFHPLEMGEAALSELFGYELEGFIGSTQFDPESIPLATYKRTRSSWKFW